MTGGTGAVKNTPYNGYKGPRLPKKVQLQRVREVVNRELTPLQRDTLFAYYLSGQNIPKIAADRGVHKSTVSRTLHRAEEKLRKYLKY